MLQAKIGKIDAKALLSTLWIFASLNYLYCDVVGLMDTNLLKQFLTGSVNDIEISQGFLLGASMLVEIPMAMVLISRILSYKANRLSNIVAGFIMTIVQITTLFLGSSTIYYIFFSIIEITTTAFIVWYAWCWKELK